MSRLNPGNLKFPGKQLIYADFSNAVADLLERGWTQGHFAFDKGV